MIEFINYDYIVYIFSAGSVAAACHLFYSIWRRMAVNSAAGSREAARSVVAGLYFTGFY